jgi:hypothetical protein
VLYLSLLKRRVPPLQLKPILLNRLKFMVIDVDEDLEDFFEFLAEFDVI